jgi:hypothetical protein
MCRNSPMVRKQFGNDPPEVGRIEAAMNGRGLPVARLLAISVEKTP